MKKILIVGSINMDYVLEVNHLPHIGETILCNEFNLMSGGKGANQACTCATLGVETTLMGAVGNDDNGEELLNRLDSRGINTSYIKQCNTVHSGMAFISIGNHGDNIIIVEQGANCNVTIDYIKENSHVIDEADIIILQLEIPIDTVTYIAKIGKQKGKFIVLDPAPASSDLPNDLLKHVDLIKPNETELKIMTGIDVKNIEGYKQAANSLIEKGVPEIIITLGEKGALYFNKNNAKYYQGKNVTAIDTSGAGDSFTAALGFMLAKGHNIEDSIPFAIEISALVVTRKGAQSSIPSADEANKLYEMIIG